MGAELLFVLMVVLDNGVPVDGKPAETSLAMTTRVYPTAEKYKTSLECQAAASDLNTTADRAATHGQVVRATLADGTKGNLVGAWCNVLPAKE